MEKETSASIGNWHLNAEENVFVGQFGNVADAENGGIFPGQRAGNSIYRMDVEPDAVYTPQEINEDDYLYCYKGSGYFYGITKENTEVIAVLTDGGKIIPTRQGIGGYTVTCQGGIICESTGLADFTPCEKDGYKAVKVNYNAAGENKAVLKNSSTYIFKEYCFDVDTEFEIICEQKANGSSVTSKYINRSNSFARRLNMDWIYPENNDFAYKEVDRLIISETYGDYVIHYAEHDPNSDHKYIMWGEIGDSLKAYLKKTDLGYIGCAKYSVAVTANDLKEGYEGLAKTHNREFAAGVAAVSETDNTTMFVGKRVKLNLNVYNLSDNDIIYSVKYNIMGYDGDCIESAVYYGNKLPSDKMANRNLCLDLPKYGMYYLNYYVTAKDKEYRECYPFCAVEDFEFKHRKENRLGICATHHETEGQGDSTISLCNKMGLSIVRIGSSAKGEDFIEKVRQNDMTYVIGVAWSHLITPENRVRVQNSLRDVLTRFPDAKYVLIANEVDSKTKANYVKSKEFLENHFIPYSFEPLREVVENEFPEMKKKMIWESNCHGTVEWFEAFKECGIWDESEVIDIHTYSSPSGPDKIFTNNLYSMHANTFSNEYAMERWKRVVKRYGEKRMIVGETGYPTPAACSDVKEIDIRTGADFNVRIAMLLLEAGCEDIIYYCIYDRTSFFIGSSAWNELYFGACYNYDYNGVYMPKPWAPAFANLTRRMDGFKKVSFFDKYEENEFGTLRAFKVEKEDSEFAVLWSNIYLPPNSTVEGRVNRVKRLPAPAWENRWLKTEIREFDAVGDTVTVVDIMGNETAVKAENGKVKLEISGSPVYVYGIC